MTHRERFIKVLKGETVDRIPFISTFLIEEEILTLWEEQGLKNSRKWKECLGFEGPKRGWIGTSVNQGICPAFKSEVLEENENYILERDTIGRVIKRKRGGPYYLRICVEYPVKDRNDWECLKTERLNPNYEGRFPKNWHTLVGEYKNRDYPLALGGTGYGLYGTARNLLGDERLLTSFYLDKKLVLDIMNYITDMWISIWSKMAEVVNFDIIEMWEDMASNDSSLISPDTFREFMLPCYRKISRFAEEHNIPIVMLIAMET